MSYEFFAIGGKYRDRETDEIVVLKDPEFQVRVDGVWNEDYILYRDDNYFFKAIPKEQFKEEFEFIGYRK